MANQGITEFRFAEDYSNEAYYYHATDGKNQAVFGICKNKDGLTPIIKECDKKLYVGYGHCIDIMEQFESQRLVHRTFDSLIYDMLVVSGRIIAILELDVVLFDPSGDIAATHNVNDIVASYRICGHQLLISTVDGKKLNISI